MTAQIRAALTWAVVLATVACTAGSPAPTPPVPPPPATSTSVPSTTPPTTPVTTPPTSPPTSPPPSLPASLTGACWSALPTERAVVALTFDAGGNDAGVASILATLRRAGVPATFFVTGRWAEVYPAQTRTIASRYPVGNHTQTHADLTTLPNTEVVDEVRHAERTLEEIAGRDPRPFFRFPYGATSAATIDAIHALGYGCIGWSLDTLGWQGTSDVSVASIVHAVHDGLRPGLIVLMHVGANPDDASTLDADALPSVIRTIRAHGYGFVALAEAL